MCISKYSVEKKPLALAMGMKARLFKDILIFIYPILTYHENQLVKKIHFDFRSYGEIL